MIEHSRQALVGAFGDAYISLAIADIDELSVSNFALLDTADFDTPMQAVERYLASVPRCPDKVSFALAATVDGDAATFNHRDWTLTRNDVRATTLAEHVCLVNDTEATALMLPILSAHDLHEVRPGTATACGTRALLMAGAAVGIAGLVHAGNDWVPVVGNGGGMRFVLAPADEAELGGPFPEAGPVACEDVFTGRGLVALYRRLAARKGVEPSLATARQVAAAGLSGEDAVAVRCLQLMATWLGRLAGDVALLYGARGGVYLGGGLVANIVPALETGHFRAAFEERGRHSAGLARLPVRVIKTAADAGLRGAALAMARALPPPLAVRPAARMR